MISALSIRILTKFNFFLNYPLDIFMILLYNYNCTRTLVIKQDNGDGSKICADQRISESGGAETGSNHFHALGTHFDAQIQRCNGNRESGFDRTGTRKCDHPSAGTGYCGGAHAAESGSSRCGAGRGIHLFRISGLSVGTALET